MGAGCRRTGFARAALDLAYLYEQGKGVPLDYVSAYVWYKSAADHGEKRAAARLRSISTVMTADQIRRATAAAGQMHLPVSTENDSSLEDIGEAFTER